MKTNVLKLLLSLTVVFFIGCSVENTTELNQPNNDLKKTESNKQSQRTCNVTFPTSNTKIAQNQVKIKIEYAPITTFNSNTNVFTYDYQTRRTNFRNSFLAINPNISFEQLSEKKDLLITTYQILASLEDDLCNAYINYEVNEIIKSTIIQVCWNTDVSEYQKQVTRNNYIANEDLEFINYIYNDCEIWIFRGCCKTGVVGGGVCSSCFDYVDLNND